MNIVVLIKGVQDGRAPDYHEDDLRIKRSKENLIMDIESGNMLETAVRFKENNDMIINITALCMGNSENEDVLTQALAVGADEAVHINDANMEGSDTTITAEVLAAASNQINADLILAGNMSQDGRTGNTGPMISEYLKIPEIQNVSEFNVEDDTVTAVSIEDDMEITTNANMPAVIIGKKQKNILRNIAMADLMSALEKEIKTLTGEDLSLKKADLEPRTEVFRVFERRRERKHIIVDHDDNIDMQEFIGQIKMSASEFI